MVVTLAESLRLSPARRLPLPNYPTKLGPAPTVHASGNSTTTTDAPKFAMTSPPGQWEHYGALAYNDLMNDPATANLLNAEHLSEREPAMFHVSEGDVVRASAMYLLHPVNQALSLLTAESVLCRSEFTTHNVRTDIAYYRGERSFAVVEFKKRGVIKVPDFRAGIKNITPATSENVLVAKAALNDRTNLTFFEGNAIMLMKQAASYATNHCTRYVALFNWDAMVLCYFSKLDPTEDRDTLVDNGVGNYCHIDIIPFAESHRMRACLLGFLVHAYNETP